MRREELLSLTRVVLMVVMFVVGSVHGVDFRVCGYVRTSLSGGSGEDQIVTRMRVEVWEKGSSGEWKLGEDYTSEDTGFYSVTFNDSAVATPDVQIKVRGIFLAPDGQYVEVHNGEPVNAPLLEEVSAVWYKIAPGTTVINHRLSSNQANVGIQAAECLSWLMSRTDGWNMPCNLVAYADPCYVGSGTYGGDYIHVGAPFYDVKERFSVTHHETGHWVFFKVYGENIAPTGAHQINSDISEAFALKEAWPHYLASLSATPDWCNQDYMVVPQPCTGWWRGLDNDGSNNAGDVVEGALWRVWMNGTCDFGGVFSVLRDHHATVRDFKAWLDEYGADKNWDIESTFRECQENGIVYTRAKDLAIIGDAPPSVGPESVGNMREIDDITFVRGIVSYEGTECTRDDLELGASSSTIPASCYRLGYKSEGPAGLMEDCSAGMWTFLIEGAGDFNTSLVTDGDYDLVLQAMSIHLWWDSLKPSFMGDGGMFDSTEKWLKHLRTWYNQDDSPDTDNEGKIIIDNRPPAITNRQPE